MGAIVGVFERHGVVPPDALAILQAGARGRPDGGNHWSEGPVALGYQRTASVQEIDDGTWPLHDAGSGLVLTADVRLDNRDDLLEMLALSVPDGPADGRLILRAWQKWGRDCPRYLVGDYAFAIWDARQRMLFCARDHVGARPFYFSLTPGRFVFASDIGEVLAMPGVPDRLDDNYVAATLLGLDGLPSDRTHFTAVRKLPPAHSLTVQPDRERLERHWFPANVRDVRFSTDAGYVEAARALLTQAVHDRLRTTQPAGVHLSGGLDSSGIAALAARERRRQNKSPPVALCWQPPPTGESASSWEHTCINAVCEQEGLSPRYCPMTTVQTVELLRRDPLRAPVTSTLIVEEGVQRYAAANGIRLILTGWGGDEGLSAHGRGYAAELLLKGRWRALYRQSHWWQTRPWKLFAREAFALLVPDSSAAIQKFTRSSSPAELMPLVHADVLRTTKRRAHRRERTSVRSTLIATWTQGELTERIESWHASGARYGLAYAYPLLDRRVLEFVAGLPPEQHVRQGWKRWLMRRTLEGILPDFICWQQDKSDPVRSEQGLAVAREALLQIGRELAGSPRVPTRARYLDMPRLLRELQPEPLKQRRRVGDLLRAVQFLDFS